MQIQSLPRWRQDIQENRHVFFPVQIYPLILLDVLIRLLDVLKAHHYKQFFYRRIKNGRQISNFLRCTTKLNKTIFINIVQTRNETRGDEKVYAAFSWIWCVIYDHSFFCCFYFMGCMFYDFIFWVTIVETDYINNLGAQIISLTRTM